MLHLVLGSVLMLCRRLIHKAENIELDPYVCVDFHSAADATHAKFAKDGAQACGVKVRVTSLGSFAARNLITRQVGS